LGFVLVIVMVILLWIEAPEGSGLPITNYKSPITKFLAAGAVILRDNSPVDNRPIPLASIT